ncbi:ApbE family lipoprotein [Pseudodesulfovibrio mercurii]|uniref:ApbE family lipoprotein n=1 Tax=Pseudodesulfovibrio mercurii TaxID=641491 RepID=F0JKI9_9BACT|nr:UPF0280 family protein [Pseudodesulfovibrio mercurii]EGB16438.1 ApbE family lipoprotein [Pseudodesulfovibrio mercurii]
MGGKHLSSERGYRRMVRAREGEVRFQVAVEQTDLLVVAELDLRDEIAAFVTKVRGDIKNWILFHREFAESLTPVAVPDTAPDIVRAMADAAASCGVGPMAAVAGAVAQAVGEAFAPRSPNILVENGGDTYLCSTRERVVALLAEPESGASIGLRLAADAFPVALCASSGTIGHSLSLGTGDLVAVRARDARLADAAATALGNLLHSEKDLDRVLKRARELAPHGLDGVFAQFDAKVAAWGDLELVALD